MGAFRGDGSWWPEGKGNALTAFVWSLCKRRRASFETPAELAAEIRTSDFASGWSRDILDAWERLTQYEHWPVVPVARSIDEAVKRAGHGPAGRWGPNGIEAAREA